MKTKTCGDCRWFDGEKCNAHEPPVEDNEEACSYFQRKRAKPAAPTAKGWAESDYARRVASIALANGYVKLEPGQVMVDRIDLAALLDYWFGNCPNDKFGQACQVAAELRAALEVKP
jgi:hypothetical protein